MTVCFPEQVLVAFEAEVEILTGKGIVALLNDRYAGEGGFFSIDADCLHAGILLKEIVVGDIEHRIVPVESLRPCVEGTGKNDTSEENELQWHWQ